MSRLGSLYIKLGEPDGPSGGCCELGDWAADEIERLRALSCEPMRVIAVAAIRSVTACPDIKGNDLYLSEEIMRGVAEYINQTDT